MGYVGQKPSNGRFIELDALTASATATYTLQYNSVNYAPESVHNLIVSINGVVQKPSSMSLSGSSLTVGATLSSSDTIDYVRVLGDVGSVVTPTDGSVTAAKIGTGAVTTAKLATGAITSATLPTGCVLQVVSTTYSSETLETNASFSDTGLSLAITPNFSTSKVLVLVHQMAKALDGAGRMNLLRGSTSLEEQYFGNGEGEDWYGSINVTYLDSPSTTSATTYKTQMRTNGAGTVGVNSPVAGCTITLMEIAG